MIESVIEKFKLLKLKTCADNLSQCIELAKEKNWSTLQVIEHFLDLPRYSLLESLHYQQFR